MAKQTFEEFEALRASMSNEELLKTAKSNLSELCKTGGRSFTMNVPPRIDDTDLIFDELIKRYEGACRAIKEQSEMNNDQFGGKH